MYSYLKGLLVAIHPTYVIVDVQGIGYIILTSCRTQDELLSLHQTTVQFYTAFVVREHAHSLYGFLTSEERDIFEVLMNVVGVGPKLALSLIGHLSFSELQDAVIKQDFKTLCLVPGVGKKTAERLVVELKDKLSDLLPIQSKYGMILPQQDSRIRHIQDAVMALVNLGYNQHAAHKAVKQTADELPESIDLAVLITASLQKI
jgi:Holliday junction DNA helicase RuvA